MIHKSENWKNFEICSFWLSCENFVAVLFGTLITLSNIPADFRRGKTLNACEELVSFDFFSLFTKIPVDLAVKVAEERLREDASLGQRTSLPAEDIIQLLSFCLKTTKFANNGSSAVIDNSPLSVERIDICPVVI